MKIFMMKMLMSISILSTLLKTPMALMFSLMLQTVISIMIMNKMMNSSWFPMITFLMMIGGLLIIFMYMSSITSNEKFKTNFKIIIIMMILTPILEESMLEIQMNEYQQSMMTMNLISMTKMYSKTFMLLMMMTMYLLFTMICVNKIVKFYEGPLRIKTYE